MHEIVSTRDLLSKFIPSSGKLRTIYNFKRECIEKSLYGVDIDSGAVEIAKLRLWLSLVVDEDDINNIRPLPNLNYKIVCGDSLLGAGRNLFNNELFAELENLKLLHIKETNPAKKQNYKKQIDELILQLSNGHKDFDFEIYFSEVFHQNKGFDVVIANPPYLGQKGNKELFQGIKKAPLGKKYHQRRMDLFYFFLHLALEITKMDGIISFITTNYYLTATYADKLRKHIKKTASIQRLINFNEYKIFESALGQHNLITLLQKNNSDNLIAETAIVSRSGFYIPSDLQSILMWKDLDTKYYKLEQSEIFEEQTNYIRLEHISLNNDPLNFLHKLDSYKTLNTYCNIEQGIVSGADRVTDSHLTRFPHLKAKKGEGIFILNANELKKLNLNSLEMSKYVKKIYKNSSIKKWSFEPKDELYVLYIKSNGEYFDPGINIRNYLDRFKIILINRNVRAGSVSEEEYELFTKDKLYISYVMIANSFKAGNYYCLSYARRGKDTFETKKIVNSRRAKSNIFALETNCFYEQSDIVITTLKPEFNSILKIEYILALLNSKLFYQWFYYKGKRKGDMFELFQKPISETKIKIPSMIVQNKFKQIVNYLVDLNSSHNKIKMKLLEDQIDIMVYKLYNLNYKEVKIIDPEIEKIISVKDYEKFEI